MQKEITQLYKNKISKGDYNFNITGLKGSLYSFFASSFIKKEIEETFLFILDDKESAAYFLNDLQKILPENKNILFFPSSYKKYDLSNIDNVNLLQRTEALSKIHKGENLVIITYPDAVLRK